MKLTSQSKTLFASFNPWFRSCLYKKWKEKENTTQELFYLFINILKFMDKRTVITCIYTVTESVYSSIKMNKDILTINNHWQDVSLCYQDKAAIGRSLYLILNSIILRSIRSPCVKTLPLKVALSRSCELYVSPSNLNNFILSELHRSPY